MARQEPFRIGAETIGPGTRRTVHIPVSVLSDHTPVTLSAHVIHGRGAGPAVFVSAGIHGDEVIGVEIVRRLLRASGLASLRGTLVVVPVVNTFGFLNRSRYLPDRRDLNRSFPGHTRGSLASRLADIFMREVVARCDLGIDLHSAALHRTNLPQIRVSPEGRAALDLARAFAAPVTLVSPLREGSLRAAAQEAGVEVLLYEAGEALRFDEIAVRAGVAGILRVLRQRAMIPARGIRKARGTSLVCTDSRWLRAPQGGLLRIFRKRGDVVEEGELIAAVADPFGEAETEIRAPIGGIIIGRAVLPVVNEGDALVHLADVRSAAAAETAVEALTTELAALPVFDEDEII